MPLLAGTVTFSRFRAELPSPAASDLKRWLTKGLRTHAFRPLVPGAEDDRSTGFVQLEDHDAVEFHVGGLFQGTRALFGFRVDTIRVPSSAMKAELARWIAGFEAEHGRAPARREKATGREAVRQLLRQKTPPSTKVHDVSLDPKTGEVRIWAGSRTAVDEVGAAIEEALGVKLVGEVPSALLARAGKDPDALAPTAELMGVEIDAAPGVSDAA